MDKFDQHPVPSQPHPNPDPEPGPMQQLRQMIRTCTIPNALLFYGAPGTGKKEAALEFVKACNCTGKDPFACNICRPCKKINTGMHPDMIFLGLEDNKKNITISQIRAMDRILASRPNEAAYRMVCIRDADRMNVQAQNSLLKVLEEPPEKTFFILLARETAPLLPTVLSRCRKFRFRPVPPSRMIELLYDQGNMDTGLARLVVSTGGPDLDRAVADARHKESAGEWEAQWTAFRQWLIPEFLALITLPPRDSVSKGLNLSQKLSADTDLLLSARSLIRTVLRDLCVYRYSPDKIVNLDFFDRVKDINETYRYLTFLGWLTAFCETERRLDSNSGARLALDRFFLELSLSKNKDRPI